MRNFWYKLKLQFCGTTIVVELSNSTTEIVNAYIINDLSSWPINPYNNFKLTNYLFDATNMKNYSNKSKWEYSSYGIAFDRKSMWSLGNGFSKRM